MGESKGRPSSFRSFNYRNNDFGLKYIGNSSNYHSSKTNNNDNGDKYIKSND